MDQPIDMLLLVMNTLYVDYERPGMVLSSLLVPGLIDSVLWYLGMGSNALVLIILSLFVTPLLTPLF
jgi:hypothetical protein